MCLILTRSYPSCGHFEVGRRLRCCDKRRLLTTPETIVETHRCASCKEGGTFVDDRHQDSSLPIVISSPTLSLEGRGRLPVGKNSKHLRRLTGEGDVADDGPSWSYEDETTRKKALVNAQCVVRDAFTPGKQRARGCLSCRTLKTMCDRVEPECGTCVKFGRECSQDLGNESQKLTEEVRKPEQARSLQSEQSLNDEDPRPSFPNLPILSASPTMPLMASDNLGLSRQACQQA